MSPGIERLQTRIFLVEIMNLSDRSKDEAKRVRSINKIDAKSYVEGKILSSQKVGDVVLAQGSTNKKDREIASRLQKICTGLL